MEREAYHLAFFFLGVVLFGASLLPHLIRSKPISFPIVYVGIGIFIFLLPHGLPAPHPQNYMLFTERVTELLVIITLTGVGLKLDRKPGLKSWQSTWRLLGIVMPISIFTLAFLGWYFLGLAPASAILLGAVLAPTDPVLAAEVQTTPPLAGQENEVRFALTSESGLNDGLAFPFTHLALAAAAASAGDQGWIVQWFWHDVLYMVVAGFVAGVAIGCGLAFVIFQLRMGRLLTEAGEGLVAIAVTLISYSLTEMIGGYGFLAVFVSAVSLRQFERQHQYHRVLHEMSENMERLFMAPLLVLFGGMLLSGILAHLDWKAIAIAMAFILLVRPLAGWISLSNLPVSQRGTISFFGIRGVGSFFYLAYAANHGEFQDMEKLWAMTSLIVFLSIFIHGMTATPVMKRIER